MTIKLSRKLKDKATKETEDQEFNEQLTRENKLLEIQTHLQKLQRRQQQQEALTEQVKVHGERARQAAVVEPMRENLFARSESLMFLYQKEKARQLYQEQLAIIRQRRDYEARLANLERQHSLERLALSRKELEKDLRTIKRSEYLNRKSLESAWSRQKAGVVATPAGGV
ncbi:hypothetical protein HK405_012802 [Cladochytrium tenue]|nr:hypothetical protein HK405_012802 [Cladochytrium tenue]